MRREPPVSKALSHAGTVPHSTPFMAASCVAYVVQKRELSVF